MKCAKCGCETDCAVIAELTWFVMRDERTLFIEGVSPARKQRVLCLDCFERCGEVFKKEDE